MQDVTVRAKYVFLDVVNYSTRRSAEAQADIIGVLNNIVEASVQAAELLGEHYLYLPTGDGICIVILDPAVRYDVHLEIALSILQRLAEHNASTEDAMRRFEVRIGLNENVDNRITDINNRPNIAGAGVNLAQRVMSAGDGRQIMVGDAVHEMLRHHEKYMNSFRSYGFSAKHDVLLPVHQFIGDYSYLNVDVPIRFRAEPKEAAKLTKHVAYYIAHSFRNQDAIAKKIGRPQIRYAAVVLLSFLASDSARISERRSFERISLQTYGAGRLPFDDQLEFYLSADFWMVARLAQHCREQLHGYLELFEDYEPIFVKESGRARLREEWPEIWAEFGFQDREAPSAEAATPDC